MEPLQAITEHELAISPRSRFRAAMILALAADALQIFAVPLFGEGALSPADDLLDVLVAAILVHLLGWHWEFLPAFAAELVPGVDLVPFWTLAVISVYRKWKQMAVDDQDVRDQLKALPRSQDSLRGKSQVEVSKLVRAKNYRSKYSYVEKCKLWLRFHQ